MMRRFWTIISMVVLYLAWGTSDFALVGKACKIDVCDTSRIESGSQLSKNHLSDNQANGISDIADLMHRSLSIHGHEFQQTVFSQPHLSLKPQQSSTTRSNLRHRPFSEKIMAEAMRSRRAGHITKIFEFNIFTSSLRVAYYLHTLCRLRI